MVTAMSRLIDLCHLGRDRVIGSYAVDEVVIDPGPATCIETLLEAVHPRALLLTHIHLDHAGATGVLVRRHPEVQVYVHERGAPHLIDPTKLLKSAGQLYGDEMERLWGEVAPVPEANVHVLRGGESVEGFRVAYTPGHASHHVSYLHEASGDAYVGDVGGVRVPPDELVIAPTPPPDIDLERWRESLETIRAWSPKRLCLTHFGFVEDVTAQIARVEASLEENGDLARTQTKEKFVGDLTARLRTEHGDEIAERLIQAAPPDQLFIGLERYWRKRAER
ncbi:MAG: MBL fold metallo-hydrolase [Thermoleophilaceae bacterium]